MIARLAAILALFAASLLAQPGRLGTISPPSVAAGTPDFRLQLNGGAFCNRSFAVFVPGGPIGNLALFTELVATTQLSALVPASLLTDARSAAIFVDSSGCGFDNSQLVPFIVGPAVNLSPDSLPLANAGSIFSVQFQGFNGNAPYTYSLLTDLQGFRIDPATGLFMGTPARTGEFPFTLRVADRLGASVTRMYVLRVEAAVLDIFPTTLPVGSVGIPYEQILKTIGGNAPITFFFVQGKLPSGLAFKSDNSGTLQGTPAAAGIFQFVMAVRDANLQSATRTMTLVISATPPVITTATVPAGTTGIFYTQTFAASGGTPPYAWLIGSLDTDGFRMDPATGVFTGSTQVAGTYTLVVQLTDKNGTIVGKSFPLAFNGSLSVSTPSLPDGLVGAPYSATLQASGTAGPYTWGVTTGVLPDGLSLDPSSGQISGTPAKAGPFDFTVRVAAASGASALKTFRIVVALPIPGLSITTTSLAAGIVGTIYRDAVAATGGTPPYRFTFGASFPAGLSIDSTSGAISGIPTTADTTSVTFTVTDAGQRTATRTLAIRINEALSITSVSPLAPALAGSPYTQTLTASGGVAPYKWSGFGLPAGFVIDADTGVLAGTPVISGTLNFIITATDARGATATKDFVAMASLPSLPNLIVGGLPATSLPTRQANVAVFLEASYPLDVTGTLTLTFASAVGGSDDTVQFTSGGRTATFRIPAGTRMGIFNTASIGVVTGTVSGTITVTAALATAATSVTPFPAPTQRTVVEQAPPVLTKVQLNQTATGYDVLVTGYATTRSMVRGTFTFAPTTNGNQQSTTLQVALETAFATWFNSAASNATGGQFTLTLPITTSGPSGAVSSATVVLNNARGDSNSLSSQ